MPRELLLWPNAKLTGLCASRTFYGRSEQNLTNAVMRAASDLRAASGSKAPADGGAPADGRAPAARRRQLLEGASCSKAPVARRPPAAASRQIPEGGRRPNQTGTSCRRAIWEPGDRFWISFLSRLFSQFYTQEVCVSYVRALPSVHHRSSTSSQTGLLKEDVRRE